MSKISKQIFLIIFIGTLCSAQQTTTLNDMISTLFSLKTIDQTAVSPDGQQVAWVQEGKIFVTNLAGSVAPRRITAGSGNKAQDEGSIAWSPDSKRLAFLSDAATPGQQQLYIADAIGGRSRKLTSVKGFVSTPGWSPDGKTIALLFIENAVRAAGPLVAEVQQTGV